MFYPFKIPRIIQYLFSRYTWSIKTKQKVIYLTFDDGPTPEITLWVLNLLKRYRAKATFFYIGKNIEQHPDLAQEVLKQHHKIGNHSFSHLKAWQTKTKDYINDIHQTKEILQSISSTNTLVSKELLFRPPYGQITYTKTNALLKRGYKIILWDILVGDFDLKLSPEKSLKKTLKNTKPGSIVVFHDSLKAKKNLQYVLPKVLQYWSQQGYIFKTL